MPSDISDGSSGRKSPGIVNRKEKRPCVAFSSSEAPPRALVSLDYRQPLFLDVRVERKDALRGRDDPDLQLVREILEIDEQLDPMRLLLAAFAGPQRRRQPALGGERLRQRPLRRRSEQL